MCFLAILFVASCIPVYVSAAQNPDADDNVGVVIQYTPQLSGSGTQEDPYYGELNYRSSKISETTIETVNPLATINGGTNKYTASLHYGWNDIEFYVTSADESTTAYYHIRWNRGKLARTEHLNQGDIYSEPASSAEAADGKLVNLDANEAYEYQVLNASEWIAVSGVTEITGLPAGVYRIRYGESDMYLADSGSSNIKVYIGSADQLFSIENRTEYRIETPESVAAGQRADFKIALGEASRPILSMAIDHEYTSGDFTVTINGLNYFITDYVTEDNILYALGYILIDNYSPSAKNGKMIIKDIRLFDDNYYSVTKADVYGLKTNITPLDENSTLAAKNQLLYREDSRITVQLESAFESYIESIEGFDVCLEDGTVVASAENTDSVTVSVTGNLYVKNVQLRYLSADFTEMEEQLARIDGVNLYLYTDDTRVVVEERLSLAQKMYTVTAKDQYLVDEFVPTLKAAIDNLVPKNGIFTETEGNLSLIPTDGSLYTEASWAALMQAAEAAQTAVDEQWNRLRQDEIDALAANLKAAIDALEYKPADYAAVDEAIAKAEALDPNDYKDFSAVEAAVNAVDRTKNITEQAEVDAMAKAINDAIAALEKSQKNTTGKDTSAKSPATGVSFVVPAAGAMLVSAAAILLLRKRREEN